MACLVPNLVPLVSIATEHCCRTQNCSWPVLSRQSRLSGCPLASRRHPPRKPLRGGNRPIQRSIHMDELPLVAATEC